METPPGFLKIVIDCDSGTYVVAESCVIVDLTYFELEKMAEGWSDAEIIAYAQELETQGRAKGL